MKISTYYFRKAILLLPVFLLLMPACKEKEVNPIVFEMGMFPDTVVAMEDLNSQYDDFNADCYQLAGDVPIIFSSNRKSAGVQFDLEQADLSFTFNQTTGKFDFTGSISNDAFLTKLIQKAVTPGNDFGPYRFFSSPDGYEYMVLSSVNTAGNLDLYYLRNRPKFNTIPEVEGPFPASRFNSSYDDAYFCFDLEQDSAYFCSDRNGNFDIMMINKQSSTDVATWFNQGFTSALAVDSINSTADDKCPLILKKIMVFASNRSGGLGGFDLYYSLFKKGKWSSPVNLGPKVNSSSDEYRPVLGYDPQFKNYFLMFSSNRPGGKGGYDLYFTGREFK